MKSYMTSIQMNTEMTISAQTTKGLARQWENGDILKGTLLAKQGSCITIDLEGTKITGQGINISENVGESIYFQVLQENETDRWKLVYQPKKETVENYAKAGVPAIYNKEWYIDIGEKEENTLKLEEKTQEDLSDLKGKIRYIFNRAGDQLKETLDKSPYSVEKLSVHILENIIQNSIPSSEAISEEEIQQKIQEGVNRFDDLLTHSNDPKTVVEALLNQGMPLTGKNIEQLLSLEQRVEQVSDLDDNGIAQMVRNNWTGTISNLYKAMHSGNPNGEQAYFPGLERELASLLENQGISVEKENLAAAKFLYTYELPIDEEKINKVKQLQNLGKQMDLSKILSQGALLLQEGKSPLGVEVLSLGDASAVRTDSQDFTQIIEDIQSIPDGAVQKVIQGGFPLTIGSLLDRFNKENTIEDSNRNEDISPTDLEKIKTGKLQLEEIRLKMTVDAARTLHDKNISIETAPLQDLVKELREYEKETMGRELKEAGAEPTTKNIETYEETLNAMKQLPQTPAHVLGKVYNRDIAFTMESVAEEGKKYVQGVEAQTAYDTLGTQIRPGLGDTLKSVETQIEPLLKDIGLEATAENIRGAKILIYNDIPVTPETMDQIRSLDQRVTYVMDHLHPKVAAYMIGEGANPLEMHLDEVRAYIEEFQETLGMDVKDKVAEYIQQMDQEGSLSPEERRGIIALYRTFHTVGKQEGRAVGFLMKNRMPFTIENMLEAAKHLDKTGGKRTRIDALISKEFGFTDMVKENENSIRVQIAQALERSNMTGTQQNLESMSVLEEEGIPINEQTISKQVTMELILKQIQEGASPGALEELVGQKGYEKLSLDEMLQQLKEFMQKGSSPSGEQGVKSADIQQQMSFLQTLSAETLQNITKYGIQPTIENLQHMQQLMDDSFALGKMLEEIQEAFQEEPQIQNKIKKQIGGALENLKNGQPMGEVMEDLKQQLDHLQKDAVAMESNGKEVVFHHTKSITQMLNLQEQLQESYQIPVAFGDHISNLNIYVMDQGKENMDWEKDELKVFLSIETRTMGEISSFMHITGGKVSFSIHAEKDEDVHLLQEMGERLAASVTSSGFTPVKIDVEKGKAGRKEENNPEQSKNQINKRRYTEAQIEVVI